MEVVSHSTLLGIEVDLRVALNVYVQIKGELQGSIESGKADAIGIDAGQVDVVVIFFTDGAPDRRDVRRS